MTKKEWEASRNAWLNDASLLSKTCEDGCAFEFSDYDAWEHPEICEACIAKARGW